MISIIKSKAVKNILIALLVCAFWLGVWYLAYLAVDDELLVPSPATVLDAFKALSGQKEFYITVGMSVLRILAGFVIGIVFGLVMAFFSLWRLPEHILSPLKTVIRATPVASFIMLAWLWLKRDDIPVFISVLMVIPIVWGNVSTGIKNVSADFTEMAKVYRLPLSKRIKYVFLPGVMPYFATAACTSAGLVWKAGVAAEVLCQPKSAIGTDLFYAKSLLETADVFAWTIVVILISILLELIIKLLLKKIEKRFSFAGLV